MDNTYKKLIEAGIKLFGEKGYETVSVRDIVSDSKANLSAVSYHFGGKAELYKAVVNYLVNEVGQRIKEFNAAEFAKLSAKDMESRLSEIIFEFNKLFMSRNGVCRLNIFTRETTSVSHTFIHGCLMQMISTVREFFNEILSAYYRGRGEDEAKINFVISLLISMLRNMQHRQRLPLTSEAESEDMLNRLINLIVYGKI